MIEIKEIKFGSAVTVGGKTLVSISSIKGKQYDIQLDLAQGFYIITCKLSGDMIWVHPTNVQWSKPKGQDDAKQARAGSTRSTRA